MDRAVSDAAQAGVLFSTVLRPHRSATVKAIRVVIGLMAVIWLLAGMGFLAAGAWPVFGFLGLGVLLLYAALHIHLRGGRTFEAIDLTDRALIVRRVSYRGRQQNWSFQPYWMQVILDDPPARPSRLELRSHGRSLVIGAFLTDDERQRLAGALRQALARLSGPAAAPAGPL